MNLLQALIERNGIEWSINYLNSEIIIECSDDALWGRLWVLRMWCSWTRCDLSKSKLLELIDLIELNEIIAVFSVIELNQLCELNEFA